MATNKRKRSKLPSSVAHYGSIETITKILKGALDVKDGNITMWLTHLTMMNDANEGEYIQKYYFSKSILKDTLRSKWDEEFYPYNMPFILSTIKTTPQTRNNGYLPMWKMYGDDFKGALIRFDAKRLKKYCEDNELLFEACVYKNTKGRSTLIKRLNQQEHDFNELLRLSCLTKHTCWEYENEWRIIARRTEIDIKQRNTSRGDIKYIELKIPLDIIEEICLGPMCDEEKTEPGLLLLKDKLSQKFPDKVHFKISQSKINIR